jgi:signal transduction histidine kinase
MLASQVLLLLFVSEWLRGQYREQERILNNDLQSIFAQTEQRISDSLLDQTVAIILKTPNGSMTGSMEIHLAEDTDSSLAQIRDSVVKQFHISSSEPVDSIIKPGPDRPGHFERVIIKSVRNTDSNLPYDMKKVLRIALMQTANARGMSEKLLTSSIDNRLQLKEFSKDLLKRKYPFTTHYDTGTYKSDKHFSFRSNTPNALPIRVSGYQNYLFKTILPQSAFSLLLLLLTAAAFWLAYRNMKRQAQFSEQKDSMMNNISHELKTPVATTKVVLEALNSFNVIDDPARTKRYLQVAEWEMERLENMIDRVMNIMQSESGNISLNKADLNFADVLNRVIKTLQPILTEKNIALQEENIDAQLQISADKVHLAGAIYNILDNAIKYGGNLIKVSLEARNQMAVLAICDNGPGIPAAYHKKIFESFFRMPTGDIHNVKGHGLGLSYSKYIIEQHGGSIGLENNDEPGATFVISLPLKRQQ